LRTEMEEKFRLELEERLRLEEEERLRREEEAQRAREESERLRLEEDAQIRRDMEEKFRLELEERLRLEEEERLRKKALEEMQAQEEQQQQEANEIEMEEIALEEEIAKLMAADEELTCEEKCPLLPKPVIDMFQQAGIGEEQLKLLPTSQEALSGPMSLANSQEFSNALTKGLSSSTSLLENPAGASSLLSQGLSSASKLGDIEGGSSILSQGLASASKLGDVEGGSSILSQGLASASKLGDVEGGSSILSQGLSSASLLGTMSGGSASSLLQANGLGGAASLVTNANKSISGLLSPEQRAAIVIQDAWRQYRSRILKRNNDNALKFITEMLSSADLVSSDSPTENQNPEEIEEVSEKIEMRPIQKPSENVLDLSVSYSGGSGSGVTAEELGRALQVDPSLVEVCSWEPASNTVKFVVRSTQATSGENDLDESESAVPLPRCDLVSVAQTFVSDVNTGQFSERLGYDINKADMSVVSAVKPPSNVLDESEADVSESHVDVGNALGPRFEFVAPTRPVVPRDSLLPMAVGAIGIGSGTAGILAGSTSALTTLGGAKLFSQLSRRKGTTNPGMLSPDNPSANASGETTYIADLPENGLQQVETIEFLPEPNIPSDVQASLVFVLGCMVTVLPFLLIAVLLKKDLLEGGTYLAFFFDVLGYIIGSCFGYFLLSVFSDTLLTYVPMFASIIAVIFLIGGSFPLLLATTFPSAYFVMPFFSTGIAGGITLGPSYSLLVHRRLKPFSLMIGALMSIFLSGFCAVIYFINHLSFISRPSSWDIGVPYTIVLIVYLLMSVVLSSMQGFDRFKRSLAIAKTRLKKAKLAHIAAKKRALEAAKEKIRRSKAKLRGEPVDDIEMEDTRDNAENNAGDLPTLEDADENTPLMPTVQSNIKQPLIARMLLLNVVFGNHFAVEVFVFSQLALWSAQYSYLQWDLLGVRFYGELSVYSLLWVVSFMLIGCFACIAFVHTVVSSLSPRKRPYMLVFLVCLARLASSFTSWSISLLPIVLDHFKLHLSELVICIILPIPSFMMGVALGAAYTAVIECRLPNPPHYLVFLLFSTIAMLVGTFLYAIIHFLIDWHIIVLPLVLIGSETLMGCCVTPATSVMIRSARKLSQATETPVVVTPIVKTEEELE